MQSRILATQRQTELLQNGDGSVYAPDGARRLGYKYGKIEGGFKSYGNWTFKTDLDLMTGAIGIHGNSVHLGSAPSEGEGNDVRGIEEQDDWKPYASDVAAAFIIGGIADGLPLPPSASE